MARHHNTSERSPFQDPLSADVLLVVVTDRERDALLESSRSCDLVELPIPPIHGEHRTYYDLGTIADARTMILHVEIGTATLGLTAHAS